MKRLARFGACMIAIVAICLVAGHVTVRAQGATVIPPAELDSVLVALNAMQLEGGNQHTCAITIAGALQCWGDNTLGQLGDGGGGEECGEDEGDVCRAAPVQVSGLTKGVQSVSAGSAHTCALMDYGGVRCWGANWSGQLGDGTQEDRSVPVPMSGLTGGVKAVSVGGYLTCVVKTDGTVWCAGATVDWESGPNLIPTKVAGLADIQSVATGDRHVCALSSGGGVKCWGSGDEGQLGNGIGDSSATPVDVMGLSIGVKAITAGESHTCGLMETGKIQCWGRNEEGQIGTGEFDAPGYCGGDECHLTPVEVVGINNAQAISAQANHTCALLEDNSVRCWGVNEWSQLGNGGGGAAECPDTWIEHCSPTPVEVVGLGGAPQAIATGWSHSCALMQDGSIQCWGANDFAQLGLGIISPRDMQSPVDVVGIAGTVQRPVAGSGQTCVLLDGGGVQCWGWNRDGQLGDGTLVHRNTAVSVMNLSNATSIDADYSGSCAVTEDGAVKCWGIVAGLDYPNGAQDGVVPRVMPGVESGALTVSVGDEYFGCAAMVNGEVLCWGRNSGGQLGDGTKEYRAAPVSVKGLDGIANSVVTGDAHTCSLLASGQVQCWGSNAMGELGIGKDPSCNPDSYPRAESCFRLTPVTVPDLGGGAKEITAGYGHTCALLKSGAVKCWGQNYFAQIGDGTLGDTTVSVDPNGIKYRPTDVVGLTGGVASLSAGVAHTCAVLDDGSIRCWGDNDHAQLGDGGGGVPCGSSDVCRTMPVRVEGLSDKATHVAPGSSHTCALLQDGHMQCWGSNYRGQAGDGNRWRAEPAYVSAFEALATLTITKTVVGAIPTGDWQFAGDGDIGAFTLPAAGGSQAFPLELGSYTITETAVSGYAVEIACTDGASATGNTVAVTLEPAVSVGCTFTNTQQTSTVQGTIRTANGTAIEGATVSLADTITESADLLAASAVDLSAVTDAEGKYRIDGVPVGTYTLTVTLRGQSEPAQSQSLNVGAEPVTDVEPIAVQTSQEVYLPAIRR